MLLNINNRYIVISIFSCVKIFIVESEKPDSPVDKNVCNDYRIRVEVVNIKGGLKRCHFWWRQWWPRSWSRQSFLHLPSVLLIIRPDELTKHQASCWILFMHCLLQSTMILRSRDYFLHLCRKLRLRDMDDLLQGSFHQCSAYLLPSGELHESDWVERIQDTWGGR